MRHRPAVDLVSVAPGDFPRRLETGQVQTVHITKTVYWQTTPVTAGLYRAYLNAAGLAADPVLEIWDGGWRQGPHFSQANSLGGDLPVVGVSYEDALAFAAWLSQRDSRAFRLPTEAEFELAARAACSCGTACSFGRGTGREAGSWPDAFVSRWRDAARSADPYGIYGMNGVLWQWCSDWYAPYPATPAVPDPQGPPAMPSSVNWKGRLLPAGRVIRGGSYSYPAWYGNCGNRHLSFAGDRNVNLGFRVVTESA